MKKESQIEPEDQAFDRSRDGSGRIGFKVLLSEPL